MKTAFSGNHVMRIMEIIHENRKKSNMTRLNLLGWFGKLMMTSAPLTTAMSSLTPKLSFLLSGNDLMSGEKRLKLEVKNFQYYSIGQSETKKIGTALLAIIVIYLIHSSSLDISLLWSKLKSPYLNPHVRSHVYVS